MKKLLFALFSIFTVFFQGIVDFYRNLLTPSEQILQGSVNTSLDLVAALLNIILAVVLIVIAVRQYKKNESPVFYSIFATIAGISAVGSVLSLPFVLLGGAF